MKKLTEISVSFTKSDYEKIYAFLYFLGVNSILEQDGKVIFYTSENRSSKIIESLKSSRIVNSGKIKSKPFLNKNWNLEWEKSIEPVFIQDKIIIYPSWKKNGIIKYKNRIKIQIDPKMSFGTGHNETTQLVLDLMCDYLTGKEKYFLDFGCGTGVLSIAALKLGLKKGVAIDIDSDSIENAEECFKQNKTSGRIKLIRSSIESIKEKNFDVIFANIIRSVIKENMPYVFSKLKNNGKLFLSGILVTEMKLITKILKEYNFNIIEIRQKGEWLGICALKNDK